MRRGVRLGVDVGAVRIGVAASDPDGLLATPVVTLRAGGGEFRELARLVDERGVLEVIVGLPRSLHGGESHAAGKARAFADTLARRLGGGGVPVRLVDERLSTVSATAALRSSGVRAKKGRAVVDQAAAVVILQTALDAERASGRPPGELVGRPH